MKYNRQAFCNSSDTEKNRIIEEEISLETHNGTTKDDLLMLLEWAYYKKNKQDSESNDGWIPVDERLPEDDVDVLITYADIDDENYTDICITTYGYAYLGGNKLDYKKWRNPFEYFSVNYKVIAWKPLPKPYRTERSNEHDGE